MTPVPCHTLTSLNRHFRPSKPKVKSQSFFYSWTYYHHLVNLHNQFNCKFWQYSGTQHFLEESILSPPKIALYLWGYNSAITYLFNCGNQTFDQYLRPISELVSFLAARKVAEHQIVSHSFKILWILSQNFNFCRTVIKYLRLNLNSLWKSHLWSDCWRTHSYFSWLHKLGSFWGKHVHGDKCCTCNAKCLKTIQNWSA